MPPPPPVRPVLSTQATSQSADSVTPLNDVDTAVLAPDTSPSTTRRSEPVSTPAPTPAPPPRPGGTFPAAVERWRPLVADYFAPRLVDQALSIIACESHGDPEVTNPYSGAAGLFQHIPRYWPERAAASGFPGASIYDGEANIAAAAWLVRVSVDSGLKPWYFWTCRP